MTDIKYAAVIVTYNRDRLLQECIDKVQNQTIAPHSMIVVNNASTDDTKKYLAELKKKSKALDVIDLPQNIGGAGGFSRGIERALEKDVDCVLVIDDDAMLAKDYMEQILRMKQLQPQYKALAGTVKVEGRIDPFHRRNLKKAGLISGNCKEQEYGQPAFPCDIASFCGLVVESGLIRQIGLPHEEYFILYDDTEYCLRIHQHSRILVVTDAILHHKTKRNQEAYPRRYDWKDYYAVRNKLLMVNEHGNFIDKAVNLADLWIHVVFRNWLFGIIKRDGYDWKYERSLVKEAVRDARSRS